MNLSLPVEDLAQYYQHQLNAFFPDHNLVEKSSVVSVIDTALDRLQYCFSHVAFNRYNENGQPKYDHLYADHNIVFNWFLANEAYKAGDLILANKLYYLNKVMHAVDCMYNTAMPDIFLIFHGSGTMLGKAQYDNFFVALQGCTVGSHKGQYPVFGKGVALTANTSVIGRCNIGNRVTVGTRAMVFAKDIQDDTTVAIDPETGITVQKKSSKCYAQTFFNVDLTTFSSNQ